MTIIVKMITTAKIITMNQTLMTIMKTIFQMEIIIEKEKREQILLLC